MTTTVSPNTRAKAMRLTTNIQRALETLSSDHAKLTLLIKQANDQEVWTALGETRQEWFTKNFAGIVSGYDTELRRSIGVMIKEVVPAITSREIATLTGTSQSTASRDMNEKTRTNHAKQERKRKAPKAVSQVDSNDQVIEGEVADVITCSHGCPVHCPSE